MSWIVRGRNLSPADRRRLLRAGQLRRVARGVYQVDDQPVGAHAVWVGSEHQGVAAAEETVVSTEVRRATAALHRELQVHLVRHGEGLVVARSSAAALWGLDGFEPPVPAAFNAPVTSGIRSRPVHRVRPLEGVTRLAGLDTTGIGQTLVELGAGLRPRGAARNDPARLRPDELVELALESALRRGLVREGDLVALLNCCGNRRAGAAVLHDVLARRPCGVPATESYLETRGIQVLRNAGIAPVQRQVEIHDRRGRYIKRVDVLLAGRVIVEFDGAAYHGPERDHVLWAAFGAAGYQLVAASFTTVTRHPTLLVAQVRDALEEADLRHGAR